MVLIIVNFIKIVIIKVYTKINIYKIIKINPLGSTLIIAKSKEEPNNIFGGMAVNSW